MERQRDSEHEVYSVASTKSAGTAVRHVLEVREAVANRVRLLDEAFIGADGHSATGAFHDYALPLLGPDPFPPYGRL